VFKIRYTEIVFYEERCEKEFKCPLVEKCPTGAIIQEKPRSPPKFIKEKCNGCRYCVKNCPGGAFSEEF
jgi:Fe-S-cluster-containing hydrogenase component 2